MSDAFVKMALTWLPFVILIAVWIFFMRRMGGGSGFQTHCREHMAAQTEAQLHRPPT